MVDVTPAIPAGRQVVEAYGDGRFRITGVAYAGSVIVLPERTVAWPVTALTEVTIDSLAPVTDPEAAVELLLLGCGAGFNPAPASLRGHLREMGIIVDAMDTGAACRTYNVLLAEERRVAAALIAVE